MKPTIKDVARKANVSIATVSRILNNLGGYSPGTKEKVDRVIVEMNYEPNAIARGLVSKKTRTIGVLHPSMSGRFTVDLLRGIENYTHSQNYSVIICNTDHDGKRTMEYIRLLGEKQVEGIIFASEVMTEEYENALLKLDVPVILVSTISFRHNFPLIRVDNFKASYDATVHLINKGHRDIVMVAGYADSEVAGIPREKGFRKALEDNNLRNDKSSI
ncbi:MAG: LacI family DNA-binding transcriptional regulator, partial [Spirochaetaceae bacterium]|nr:LacI family DNA-binding transcriptional regulator [Spirochaetaceae bacterium]